MAREDLYLYTVRELLNGATQTELSERLANCVAAASETGKPAALTLKLTIKPLGNSGQYEIRDKITDVIPELDRGITLMFGTPEHNLSTRDPKQRQLDLRAVDQTPDRFHDDDGRPLDGEYSSHMTLRSKKHDSENGSE